MGDLHSILLVAFLSADPLGPGNQTRTLTVGEAVNHD